MPDSVGDFLFTFGPAGAAVRDPRRWPGAEQAEDVQFVQPAPGIALLYRGDVRTSIVGPAGGLGIGREPKGGEPSIQAALQGWTDGARQPPPMRRGRYAIVLWDAPSRQVVVCADAFRTYPIYYAVGADWFVCASDLRLILATGLVSPRPQLASLYHYLNFSYVPSPHNALAGIEKLPAGHVLEAGPGRAQTRKAWNLVYREDLPGDDATRAAELRDRIVATVEQHRPEPERRWGTFLSGGTDSSSISGILAAQDRSVRVDSFSIGFDESGFDELGYSRIASQHFGLRAHERKVSEADAVALIPRLASTFDEPFGNSSAIPTYCCAELAARSGIELLIAGDGGDEIFGGNERYRKDQIFGAYHRAPGALRAAGRLVARLLDPVDLRFANRVKNFIYRGSLPNPDRFYSDDSFASDHFNELLSDDFRAAVGRDDSLQLQREVYWSANADAELNRLMHLDLMMTIADNDVVKVVRTTRAAGVGVDFPYLDRALVEFTGRLPWRDKVRGLEKRYLFKRSMAGILPEEIQKKKKHGFGLPVTIWLRRPGPFRDLVNDVVLAPRALKRGYFAPEFIRDLLRRHERGAWDYSAEIYILLMLELWHRNYVD
ncbi:MAG TPA: asparagine synthase C-terminal domain-containing protein [Burkholderiaceae bacterium]|nr:asparagine synthase C-terminal domain-containing protein [Burkholderiaceae bacterium]